MRSVGKNFDGTAKDSSDFDDISKSHVLVASKINFGTEKH